MAPSSRGTGCLDPRKSQGPPLRSCFTQAAAVINPTAVPSVAKASDGAQIWLSSTGYTPARNRPPVPSVTVASA